MRRKKKEITKDEYIKLTAAEFEILSLFIRRGFYSNVMIF